MATREGNNSTRVPRGRAEVPETDAVQRGERAYAAPALDKGLDILELLADAEAGLTMAEMAPCLGRSISEIFRMVVTLQRRGWVTIEPGDRYRLSSRMFELAHRYPPLKNLSEAAMPTMQKLARQTLQSCHISIMQAGRIIVIAHVDAPGSLSVTVRTGALLNPFTAMSGRILLAFCREEQRARMIEDHLLITGDIPMSLEDYNALLAPIRDQGFGCAPSPKVRGVTDLGCPVWTRDGNCAGALTIPYLEDISAQHGPSLQASLELLRKAAAEISRGLGHQPAPVINTPS
jgi:DNA-binding IclR family transcriptional regulator